MIRKTILGLSVAVLFVAACGDDDGTATTVATTTAPPGTTASSTTAGATTTAATPATEQGGTVTVDGTTYAFVASVQCGIYDAQNQYYISGVLPELASGEILDLAFSRDSDVHELTVTIGGVGYSTFTDADIESTISGRTVTGTATLTADDGSGTVEASFQFQC